MMFRADKMKLPIALVPNGSGNDTCKSIGLNSIDQALEYIKKGDTLKVDLNRVYIDGDTFEEIENQTDDQKYQRIRYSLINSSVGFIAKVVHSAISAKSWAGSGSYFVGGVKEFFASGYAETYKI
jgi:diacylglycerol kinase family enzyme